MEQRVIDLDGPLHYLDFGGEGPLTVLVHGLGGSSVNWIGVGESLARRGRVVAPDLAGFGRTPRGTRSAAVAAQIALLRRFLDALTPEPVTLVGNSMGGLVSLFTAAEAPERVRGLVLVDPAAPPVVGGRMDPAFAAGLAVMAVPFLGETVAALRFDLTPEQHVRDMMALVCARPDAVRPEIMEAHVRLARERVGQEGSVPAFVEAARSLLPYVWRARYDAVAARVTAPTLLMHGSVDRLVPLPFAERLALRHTHWTWRVLHGVGHAPMIEAPDRFVGLVESWADAERLPVVA